MVRFARRRAALLTTAVVLFAPGAALAQSGAGDQQYEDPLGGQTQSTPAKPTPKPATPATPAGTPSSAPKAAAAQSTTPAASAPSAARSSSAQLPRTGLDAGVLALLGLAVALLGLGLRLRTADGHG